MSREISDNDDDLSDVSMPEESDDSGSDDDLAEKVAINQKQRRQSNTPHHPQLSLMGQNSMVETRSTAEAAQSPSIGALSAADRARLNPSGSARGRMFAAGFDSLPLEVWQHIFTFTTPKTLGSLLRVNKATNFLLDPSSPYPAPASPHKRSHLARRQPDDIWQQSRKRFRPRMPTPLDDMTELSMWRLACASRCTSCDKKSAPIATHDQWRSGPGENGVRPIWAFAESACGLCLKDQTVKEVELLLSAAVPSTLICALPFIFLTNELNVVSSSALQQGQQPPSSIQISKYFSKTDVDNIKKEYFRVKNLGEAAADEWLKGLDNRGKARRLDIARWERWEAAGGLQRICKDEPDNLQERVVQKALPSSLPPRPATFHGYSFGQPSHAGSAYPPPPGVPTQAGQVGASLMSGLPQRLNSPAVYGAYGPPGTQKTPRTKEEAENMKLARRAEIERRCRELLPPISPSVLAHMPSFQASLHIIKPLDDTAWDMLKPRLLSQRAEAEQREKERLASTRVLQHQTAHHGLDGRQRVSEESIEREWEETEAIVKNRIGPYSDEVIRKGWGSGSKVTKESAPRFAAEVLMYVWKRFHAEVAKDDAAARIAGHPPMMDPPSGPFTRKLTMENMRWVFETKIKPHTDQHRKEIFLCNACDTIKWYAFEGVCQHYASKHTSSSNSGTVTVHWRAEWPEEPPFKPEPHLARSPVTRTSELSEQFPHGVPAPAPALGYPLLPGASGNQTASSAPGPPAYSSQMPQLVQQQPFSDPYSQPAVTYVAPGTYQPYPPSSQFQQYPAPPAPVYAPFYPPSAQDLYSNPSIPLSEAPQSLNQAYLTSGPTGTPIAHQQNAPLAVVDNQSHIPPPVYRTEEYKAQLQDMALTAKSLWTETSGVKDIPGSVRVHVILFHLLQRLRERYTEDPPLSMLVDGIQNVKEMRIVRNVNGIACKTCTEEKANKPINPYTVSSKTSAVSDRKLYSLPQLVNHFQSMHQGESAGTSAVDWRTDMVELPDKKKIRSLEAANGMDEHKLRLLREALPEAFKPDTPEVSNNNLAPSVDKHGSYYNTHNLAPSVDKHESYYNTNDSRSGRSPSPNVDIRKLFNPAVDNYPRQHGPSISRRESRFNAENGRYRRSPSASDVDITKLFNPDVDNYPRQYIRGRPSGALAPFAGRGTGPSVKRKANSPLGPKRERLAPDYDYFATSEDREQADVDRYRPPHAPDSYLSRPEYNHRDVDLSRLLANAGHVAQQASSLRPAEPMHSRESHGMVVDDRMGRPAVVMREQPNQQAMAAAEQFLEDMAPDQSWETSLGSQRRPRAMAAGTPAQRVAYEDDADTLEAQYNGPQTDRQQITHQDLFRRRSPEGHQRAYSQREEAGSVEAQPVHSQAPSREIRHVQSDAIRYADERTSESPVYVVDEAPRRRQYRAVSPGGQHFVDEPAYEPRSVMRRVEQPAQDQREEYYQYADEPPRPLQVQYEPEIEYIRVRDPAGDYLVERHKPRQQHVYARYEDSDIGRQPFYEDSRMRPVYEGEHVPVHVSQGGQRPRQIAYADEGRPRAVRYEDADTDERQRPVVIRVDEDGPPISHQQDLRQRQEVMYDDEAERRQPRIARHLLNQPPISRSDPAYYEEYDPSNPAPLPVAPRRVQRHE